MTTLAILIALGRLAGIAQAAGAAVAFGCSLALLADWTAAGRRTPGTASYTWTLWASSS